VYLLPSVEVVDIMSYCALVNLLPGVEIVNGITHSIFSVQWNKILAAVKLVVIPAASIENFCAVHSELKHQSQCQI
jgi:hypothetical protein